jgi:hypothetical protein
MTSQSGLSTIVRPPTNAPYATPTVLWLIGSFILGSFTGCERLSWIIGTLLVGHPLLLSAYLLTALSYNFLVRPKKYQNWKEQLLCQRCGSRSRMPEQQKRTILQL